MFLNRAATRRMKEDLDGALADADTAVALDPKNGDVYEQRAITKNYRKDYDGAVDDANRAIQINPRQVNLFLTRARAETGKGDWQGVLADVSLILKMDPNQTVAFIMRGMAKKNLGDFDGALADYAPRHGTQSKVLRRLQRTRPTLLRERSVARGAQELPECPGSDPADDHGRLMIWILRTRSGEKAAADQELSEALAKHWQSEPKEWPAATARYILGQADEAEALASINGTHPVLEHTRSCQVSYCIGMKKLLTGDKKAAVEFFKRCIAGGQKDVPEYNFAEVELKHL